MVLNISQIGWTPSRLRRTSETNPRQKKIRSEARHQSAVKRGVWAQALKLTGVFFFLFFYFFIFCFPSRASKLYLVVSQTLQPETVPSGTADACLNSSHSSREEMHQHRAQRRPHSDAGVCGEGHVPGIVRDKNCPQWVIWFCKQERRKMNSMLSIAKPFLTRCTGTV